MSDAVIEPGGASGFTNGRVDVEMLPSLRDEDFEPIDPNFLRLSLLSLALVACVAVVACIGVLVLSSQRTAVVVSLLVVGLGLLLILAVLRVVEVRHIAYMVREHDLSYRRGVLIKQVSTVPFVRVQHARIRQGPIQRQFGLATLDVHSAGPDIAIKGLSNDTAQKMKALVVERAGDLIEEG